MLCHFLSEESFALSAELSHRVSFSLAQQQQSPARKTEQGKSKAVLPTPSCQESGSTDTLCRTAGTTACSLPASFKEDGNPCDFYSSVKDLIIFLAANHAEYCLPFLLCNSCNRGPSSLNQRTGDSNWPFPVERACIHISE